MKRRQLLALLAWSLAAAGPMLRAGDANPPERVPPRVVSQVQPTYPEALAASGIKGEVLVGFIVDRDGNVADPFVITSSNAAFERPAIEAVRRWKFKPGLVNGRAVNTRMKVPVLFDVEGGGGRDAYAAEHPDRKASDTLPEGLRYDTPPQPRGGFTPVYPYALLRAGRKGKAVALFMVSAAGEVVESKLESASEPDFGYALLAAVERFKFDPAQRDHQPVAGLVKLELDFNPSRESAGAVGPSREDRALLQREVAAPATIVSLSQLDTPLVPVARPPPRYPLALLQAGGNGTATVEMLVDEGGHVRLPRAVEASDPAFGFAAVQAVAEWLFEPPQAHGKPAVARVRVPFEFRPK